MSFEVILLITQTSAVFFLAAWLSTGVFENVVLPELNRKFTSEVLDFTRMREQYPEAYSQMAYRRISNPTTQKWLFRIIVGWEIVAVVVLWVATITLFMAVLGFGERDVARAYGLLGAFLFTSIWVGFLIVGNWFCYWFCHEGAQNTHYQMTLWGFATMILLAIG